MSGEERSFGKVRGEETGSRLAGQIAAVVVGVLWKEVLRR
jgi:hypothetical protein